LNYSNFTQLTQYQHHLKHVALVNVAFVALLKITQRNATFSLNAKNRNITATFLVISPQSRRKLPNKVAAQKTQKTQHSKLEGI
jgi:hypothetical protein